MESGPAAGPTPRSTGFLPLVVGEPVNPPITVLLTRVRGQTELLSH